MNKQILKIAIPSILSNLSVPLLSSVDTALMGRQEGAEYIGAIAIGALIFNFVYWSFAFLRMGTTGLTAQAYGKEDKEQIIQILARALGLAFVSGLAILILQIPLEQLSFSILGASQEVEDLAAKYFYIRVWAAPATLCLYAFMGWFFGMQNAIYPLILTILINVVNIICNIYFVNYLGMDADGVALGTVIAQYTGFVAAIGLFLYKYRYLVAHFKKKAMLELAAFKSFMTLNADIFLRTFCLVFAFAYFDNQSAMMGDMTLAVNGVLLQFTFWVSYGVDGFGYAAESLVGKYFGAKNEAKLKQAMSYSFYWGMGLAALYSIGFAIFGESLLYVFTNQEAIIQAAIPFIVWMIVFPLAGTPAYIWDGIYIGMTASKAMRITMFLALIAFLVALHLQLALTDWGNHGLWAALIVFMAGRGIIQWWWYRLMQQRQ